VNPEEDDIERFEEQRELELLREYRDIVPMFAYVVETERRFYLANTVELNQREDGWVEVVLRDAWVWDMFRPARLVSNVRVLTRHDVNVEELRQGLDVSLLRFADHQPRPAEEARLLLGHQPQQLGSAPVPAANPHLGRSP